MLKPLFHKLPDDEMRSLVDGKITIGYILENYRQPDWCEYDDALGGKFGCWSLMDLFGTRHEIGPEFCKTCDCCSILRNIKHFF